MTSSPMPPALDRRIPGASLHPQLRRAVGIARVRYPEDSGSAAAQDVEVLARVLAALRAMDFNQAARA